MADGDLIDGPDASSRAVVSQTEFAAMRGVGKSAVSNWKAAGHLVMATDPATGADIGVDVAASIARLDLVLDPTRGRPPRAEAIDAAAAGTSDLGDARLELVREQVTRQRLDNFKRAGELVALADVEASFADWGRRARESVTALTRPELAERLARQNVAREITAILTEEIDGIFARLADQADEAADELVAEVAAATNEEDV